uniref:ABC-type multidrug transport system permease n=1 Tax=Rathayibacter sp. FH 236 TaxID=2615183 RepID=A0A5J6SKF5_9MICO|nr:ABC-type multidrug transport system permease [Rathayibacter sp. FH 236]
MFIVTISPDLIPRRGPNWLSSVFGLTVLQLSNWRWSWPQMLLTGMLAPIVSAGALGLFSRTAGGNASMYVVSGSITLALLFETQGRVATNFAFMRAVGSFDYLASFPIKKGALVAASMCAFTLLAIPAVTVTTIAASLLLRLPLHVSPMIVPAVLICLVPFVAIGAVIGAHGRSLEEVSSISVAFTLLSAALGPVAISPDLLPAPLVAIGTINPAVYASVLIRSCLFGDYSFQTFVAAIVMIVVATASIVLVRFSLPWRK